MAYVGDFPISGSVDILFTTIYGPVPTTLSGSPVFAAYADNSTTEITAGFTLNVDYDGRTGLNHIRIVASVANGYASGSTYFVVCTTGTVGGQSFVGYVVGSFSIEARSALRPTTATRTLDVAATGEAGLDFDNIKQATGATTLTNIRVPNVTLTDTVTIYTGNTVQTGDSFARLGAPTGVSIAADIAEVEAETDGIASIPTNPLLTTDTRLNHLDADISSRTKPADTQARVTLVDTLTTYTGDTPQTGDAFARLGAPAGASVSADILEANNDIDELITTVGVAGAGLTSIPDSSTLTEVGADVDELITTIGVAGAGLTAIPDSSAVTEIGADVDELIATVGIAGAGLTAIPDSSTLTEVGADVDELITSVAAIPTTPVLTGHFDTIMGTPVVSVSADIAEIEAETDDIASVKAKTDQLTFTVPNQVDANSLTGGLSAAGVRSAVGLASANLDSQLGGLATATAISTLQTELTEMHGLLGLYSGLRDAVYSGTNLVSYNLFLYSSSVNAALNDGVTGVSHQYTVTNTYSGANLLTSIMSKVS